MAKSDNRARVFAFICYPDEATCNNYLELLRDSFIPVLISPIHNPENNDEWDPDSNAEGKRHCHVMFQFEGKKSINQVEDIVKAISALGLPSTKPFIVESKLGMTKYFVHDGWPDKEQFSYNQLICLNGFKYDDKIFVPMTEILKYIDDLGIIEWCDLLDSLKINHPDWLSTVMSGVSHSIIKYLDSRRWKVRYTDYEQNYTKY